MEAQKVQVGEVICLGSRVRPLGQHSRDGYWTVDNYGILSLDPVSGVGVPLIPGFVNIEYQLPASSSLTMVKMCRWIMNSKGFQLVCLMWFKKNCL